MRKEPPRFASVMYSEDEGHLAVVEKAKKELDGLATSIANDLDLRMEKPDE
jgi:hypothetical protein